MSFKGLSARLLSAAMALIMMLAVCAPLAFAEDGTDAEVKKKINYVSLGDSMTNGLGHEGYWVDGYLEESPVTYPAKFAAWLAGVADSSDFSQNADGTATFDGDKATVNWAQLVTSGVRAEDLHFILEYGTEGAYPGDEWTYTELLGASHVGADGKLHTGSERWGSNGKVFDGYAEMYQESVRDADVITLCLGNASFGVFLADVLNQATGSSPSDNDFSFATLENALALGGVDAEITAIVEEAYGEAKAYAAEVVSSELVPVIADAVAYVVASHLINAAGALDRIVELNPDAEIIIIGVINNMNGFDFDVNLNGSTVHVDVSELTSYLLTPLNTYLAAYASANVVRGRYADATVYYAQADHVESWADDFDGAYEDFVYDADAEDLGYPKSRYWCHTRFVDDISEALVGMLLGGSGNITADDVKAYEIAAAKGAVALYEYSAANPDKVKYITAYLGTVDAVLGAFRADPVVDLDSIGLLGGIDIEGLIGSAVEGVKARYGEDLKRGSEASYDAVLLSLARDHLGLADDATDGAVREKYEALSESDKAALGEKATAVAELYAAPDALATAMSDGGLITAYLTMYGRTALARGLSSHPSAKGHSQLFDAVVEAYSPLEYIRGFSSFFTAIGGEGYAETVASELGVDFAVFGDALRACDVRALLDESFENDAYGKALLGGRDGELAVAYREAVERADLITLDFGTEDLTGFVANQVTGMLLDTYGAIIRDLVKMGMLQSAPSVKTHEMDWSRFDGLVDIVDVESALETARQTVIEAGIPEQYTYNIEIKQAIGKQELVIRYPIELYPADVAMYTVECYLYAMTNYVYNYVEAIRTVHTVNPEAEVIVVGALNPFESSELIVSGIDVGAILGTFADALDTQALTCALMMPKTTFVSVAGAETKLAANGIDIGELVSLETFTVNTAAFGASERGNEYIARQILSSFTVSDCTHAFDNACDGECNECGAPREVGDHTFGEWVTAVEPTTEAEGVKERSCTECGYKESEALARLDKPADPLDPPTESDPVPDPDTKPSGTPAGAVAAAIVGAIAAVSLAGFAIYWFAVRKKSLSDLVKVFKK